MKNIVIIGFILMSYGNLLGQSPTQPYKPKNNQKPKIIYELQPKHIPIFIGSSLLYSFGNNLVRKQIPLTEQDLSFMNRNSVNAVDRFATFLWSPTFSKVSDATFVISALSTPTLFLDKKIKKEWFTIGFMFLEATVLTYGVTQTAKGLTDRLRPYVYNPKVPIEYKLQTDAKNSFFSGHTALSATYSFLSYKIYSDFYPNSDLKPWLLGGAIGLPLITATSRVLAGKHYLSDVFTAYIIGSLIGYGLPFLHKAQQKNNSSTFSLQVWIFPYF